MAKGRVANAMSNTPILQEPIGCELAHLRIGGMEIVGFGGVAGEIVDLCAFREEVIRELLIGVDQCRFRSR